MRVAHYNGNSFPIEDDSLTVEQIQEALAAIDSSIHSTTARIEGDQIYFTVRAATKGC